GTRPEDVELLPIGECLGNWVIERVHAAGSFATVYKARHLSLERTAALKVLHHHLVEYEFLERFRQEAQAVSQLKHPNIVEVYDVDELRDGRPYLVMEWLEGRPLSQLLESRGPFTLGEALAVM